MLDIKAIAIQFEDKTLPKESWTHMAHIAVAFSAVEKYNSEEEALQYLRRGIRTYNVHVGTENTHHSGYHETLTVFWLESVHAFAHYHFGLDAQAIFEIFVTSIFASAKFPLVFYSRALLFSTEARLTWMAPDLMPMENIKKIIAGQLTINIDEY